MDNISLVRRAMEDKGLTPARLAKDSGIHSGLIGRYLRGEIAIGVKNAPKIAKALGLTEAEVVFGRPATAVDEELPVAEKPTVRFAPLAAPIGMPPPEPDDGEFLSKDEETSDGEAA